MQHRQLSSRVIMVRPAHFGFNPETALNNKFQTNVSEISATDVNQKAIAEFDNMVALLQKNGIEVYIHNDDPLIVKPDAIFPNNWITMHEDGKLITYPMFAPLRQRERSEELIQKISSKFLVNEQIHFEQYENEDKFLEGTGSMIFDRTNQLVYACISERTNLDLLKKLAYKLEYEVIDFDSRDQNGFPIYHTNVMMALGQDFVVICLESVNIEDQKKLIDAFNKTNKEIVNITFKQMNAFAGNMLQLISIEGQAILVMSNSAYQSLNSTQLKQLESKTKLLVVEIPTIEKIGGGSARCMIAENFLEPK
ncbi:MAG: amidinotransferase [Saprospiraceae bacterium]|nr:amidinotransferase [Saprospiraceae bacterium]